MSKGPYLLLPEAMQPFVAAIGYTYTLCLVQWKAGGEIYIPTPENMTENHPIAQVIGLHQAQKLAASLGGEKYKIVGGTAVIKHHRDIEIVERYQAGESMAQLAQAYQLGLRAISGIIESKGARHGEEQRRRSRIGATE